MKRVPALARSASHLRQASARGKRSRCMSKPKGPESRMTIDFTGRPDERTENFRSWICGTLPIAAGDERSRGDPRLRPPRPIARAGPAWLDQAVSVRGGRLCSINLLANSASSTPSRAASLRRRRAVSDEIGIISVIQVRSNLTGNYTTNSRFRQLYQDIADDLPMNIGQTTLGAVVIEGQAFVVEAKDVQDRGVQVVDGGDVLDGLVAKFISCTV